MPGAEGPTVGGQRDVDRLLAQHPGVAVGLELGGAGGERLVHPAAGLADALARLGLLGGLQAADRAVGQGERAAVAGVGEPCRLELVQVAGRGERGERRLDGGIDAVGVQGARAVGV